MTINSIYYLLLPCRHQRCFRFNLHSVSCCAHVQLTSLVPRNRAWTSPVEHSTNIKTSTREQLKKRARNVQPTWWNVPVLRIKRIGSTPCESCHRHGRTWVPWRPTTCVTNLEYARPSSKKRTYKIVKSWSSRMNGKLSVVVLKCIIVIIWHAPHCLKSPHSYPLLRISTKKEFYTMKSLRSWNAVLDRRVLEVAEFP